MNGFYWIALAGSQMMLLPLMLTSPDYGAAMSASAVGKVYMGMALVQVLTNPLVFDSSINSINNIEFHPACSVLHKVVWRLRQV